MDKSTERLVQAEGTAALLDRGVSVPLKELRIPLVKKPLKLRVVMRRPRLGGLIRLARVYLSLGVTAEQMKKFTKEEEMAFLAAHGKEISRMIAYTLCRGWISRRLLVGAHAGYNKNLSGGYRYGGSHADYVTVTAMEAVDALYLTSNYYRLGLSATYSQQLKAHSRTHLFAKAAFDYTHAQGDVFSHRSVLSVSLGCNF